MCLNGNSAPLSTRYLNSQLTTLWQNAIQCVDEKSHTLDVYSDEYEKTKHARALAEYHYFSLKSSASAQSTADFFFYSRFGQPELKFICNHEAVLTLTINKANLNLDLGRANLLESHADQ